MPARCTKPREEDDVYKIETKPYGYKLTFAGHIGVQEMTLTNWEGVAEDWIVEGTDPDRKAD